MGKIVFLHFGQGAYKGPNTFTWCSMETPVQWVAGAVKENTCDVINCDTKTDEQIKKAVIEYSPSIIGFSALTPGFPRALKIARELKEHMSQILFVFGGWHASLVPQEVLNEKPVDTVVIGKGENVIKDIISSPASFQGKIIDANYKHFNPVIPWRTKEIMSTLHSSTFSSIPNFASILVTPGCSFSCGYCATPAIYGKRFFLRPLSQVIAEVEMLIEDYGVKSIYIRDENPFIQKKRLEKFCQLIIERGLNKKVGFRSFGDISLVDESLLNFLREAGWREIMYGVETIDQQRLKRIGRARINAEKMLRAFELTKNAGIFSTAGIMVMYPGESLEYSMERFDFLLRYLRPDRFFVSFFTPLPGTPSWNECRLYLRRELGWEYFDFLFPVIKSPEGSLPEQIIREKNKVVKDYYGSEKYKTQMREWLGRLGNDFWPLTKNFRGKILNDFEVDIYKNIKKD